jgi:cell division cycle 2-like
MTGKSRWADTGEDLAARKREKEEKKRLKAEKKAREEEEARRKAEEAAQANDHRDSRDDGRPAKRRRLSQENEGKLEIPRPLLRFEAPTWRPCRRFEHSFEPLNAIGKGAYGEVMRARDISTSQIVAVKELESYNPHDGIPVTSLREIQTLREAADQEHIVQLLEVVTSSKVNNGGGGCKISLVMEFLEHDLMTLHQDMDEPWLPSEAKTLMLQITSALGFLHDHWILHRDLKTSNILMNNRGQIKLADFGSARFYGDPPPQNLTQLVVTLWYRAPELLLGASMYDSAVDMWSLGCVFGELLKKSPLLEGKNELDQISKIFELCGVPSEKTWPGFRRLPNARSLNIPSSPSQQTKSNVRTQFSILTNAGCDLLDSLLSLDPGQRPTANEVLSHPYFREDPRPKNSAMFPSFPSKARGERKRAWSPAAPRGGGAAPKLQGNLGGLFATNKREEGGVVFSLKLA